MASTTKGVILLNMGGPESLEDVRPFLVNLFSDREIIRLGPPFLQKTIARYIAARRAPKSRAIYEKIGGGSPLKQHTQAQAQALEHSLRDHGDYRVGIAMRYWPPFAEQALRQMLDQGVSEFIGLTLYPHYSKATTGSSVSQLQQSLREISQEIPLSCISSWPTQGSYIEALSKNISQAIDSFDNGPVEVVYSAHSLPVSFIQEGDPYLEHINQTITEVEKRTGHKGNLCFQSRSGPVEWLSPSTPEMIEELAQKGCTNMVMVPISFVSDHVETLYEIDILYREQAAGLGISLRSSKSLNSEPLFIEGLRDLVLGHAP